MRKTSKISRAEFKDLVNKVVDDCKVIAHNYVKNWRPFDSDWETIEGAAYLRLSTDDQVAVEKGSLEQQIYIAISEAEIRSKAQKTNFRITKFYIEPGITGKHDKRPEFISMQRDIKLGKFNFVIFKEIARVARETEIWKKFFKLCQEKEVEICIRGFPFNPNDPTQIFQLDIMAAFAEYESNQTSKRIKENNFSAIMTSGKFNSTPSFLGLDQLVVNGEPKVGLYTINEKEIKTVKWIMKRFCTLKSHRVLFEEIEREGVLNKDDKPFTIGMLRTLLTNKRYIGKWEVNEKNKERKQDKLMAYDRYEEIDLPHGEAVPIELWNQVQEVGKVVAGNKTKDKNSTKIYPLTPLLYHEDGSKFQGSAGWSHQRVKHHYYYNKEHSLRLSATQLEEETLNVVQKIIDDSEDLKTAILKRMDDDQTSAEFYREHMRSLEQKLRGIEQEKKKLNRRLDFLLDGENEIELQNFKAEYKNTLSQLNQKEVKLLDEISSAENFIEQMPEMAPKRSDILTASLSAKKFADEGKLKELRGVLLSLFSRIMVSEKDRRGVRKVTFVLANIGGDAPGPSAVTSMEETNVGHWLKVVPSEGLEPPRQRH